MVDNADISDSSTAVLAAEASDDVLAPNTTDASHEPQSNEADGDNVNEISVLDGSSASNSDDGSSASNSDGVLGRAGIARDDGIDASSVLQSRSINTQAKDNDQGDSRTINEPPDLTEGYIQNE